MLQPQSISTSSSFSALTQFPRASLWIRYVASFPLIDTLLHLRSFIRQAVLSPPLNISTWSKWTQAHIQITRQGLEKLHIAVQERTKTGKNRGWKQCRCAYIHSFIPTFFAILPTYLGLCRRKQTKTQTQMYWAPKKCHAYQPNL